MFIVSVFCFLSAIAHASPLSVMIDPGHGGRDDGAVRAANKESEITLQVAKKLADKLRSDKRFRVHLTRNENQAVSLADRARLTRDKEAEVFVSIHVNSNPDPKARGAEFYFQNQLAPDEESMRLAHRENSADESIGKAVQYPFLEKHSYPNDVASIVSDLLDNDRILRSSQLSKSLKTNWRGSRKSKSSTVRQAPFYVLNQMSTPSSLVELGFITNAEDLNELLNETSQKKMAEDLYRGLVEYKESMDKSTAKP